jgi:hypothetical protein
MSVLPSDPVKKLQAFAENNKETQGKFTIADEKVNTITYIEIRGMVVNTISEAQCFHES